MLVTGMESRSASVVSSFDAFDVMMPPPVIEHRLPGGGDQLHRPLDLARMARVVRLVAPDEDLLGIPEIGQRRRDIFRYIDEHGSRPAGAGDIEGLLYDARHLGHVPDEVVVLRAGPRDADDVGLLEGVVADEGGVYLAGEDDHGHRIHIGGRDARHGVRCARAGGDQRDADARGRAGVAVGRVDCGLLVADQDLPDAAAVQGVRYIEDGAAGVAEDGIDPFHFE